VRPIVFEFGENRVPVQPATAAVYCQILLPDFTAPWLRDWLLGQAKIPGQFCTKCDFNLIQSTLYQLAQNSRGQASCRRYHVALAVDQILWPY